MKIFRKLKFMIVVVLSLTVFSFSPAQASISTQSVTLGNNAVYDAPAGWWISYLDLYQSNNTTFEVNGSGYSGGPTWSGSTATNFGLYSWPNDTLNYMGWNSDGSGHYQSSDGAVLVRYFSSGWNDVVLNNTLQYFGNYPLTGIHFGNTGAGATISRVTWDNLNLSVTPEKWVSINVTRNESNYNPMPVYVKNTSTGAVFTIPKGTGSNYTFTDQNVSAGNTYNYIVYDSAGTYLSQNILVPSDAYEAKIAAQAAQAAAQQASQNASNASAAANSIINNYLSTANGIVQDSSGTVLTAARVASTNAQNAYNAAQNAVTGINNAQNALSSKIDSSTSTIGSKIDSSASSLQTNLGNKIDSSLSNLQTNLNNSITNIQSVMPPILTKVSGYNGATATKTGSINLTLDYSNATDYQIKVDNGAWGAWSSLSSLDTNGYITASGLSTTGVHTIYVQIRNGSNNPALAKGKFTCFEL